MTIEILEGYTKRLAFGCGNVYITINERDGMPARVFVTIGKAGGCQRALQESFARCINSMLEDKKPLEEIIFLIAGLRCDQGIDGIGRLSCVDALAQELKKYLIKD